LEANATISTFPDMQTHKNRDCSLGHPQYHKIRANIVARKTCCFVYLESQFQISGEINPLQVPQLTLTSNMTSVHLTEAAMIPTII
jgi:hypothetical protein